MKFSLKEGLLIREKLSNSRVVEALKELIKTTPVKLAANVLANVTGIKRNDLYTLALKLKEDHDLL